jgi:hypothetical protein
LHGSGDPPHIRHLARRTLTALLTPRRRKAQGHAAEQRFRAWLDRCVLPHIYVEQSPVTPAAGMKHHAGDIKRPDFLVDIPPISMLAFDVSASMTAAP